MCCVERLHRGTSLGAPRHRSQALRAHRSRLPRPRQAPRIRHRCCPGGAIRVFRRIAEPGWSERVPNEAPAASDGAREPITRATRASSRRTCGACGSGGRGADRVGEGLTAESTGGRRGNPRRRHGPRPAHQRRTEVVDVRLDEAIRVLTGWRHSHRDPSGPSSRSTSRTAPRSRIRPGPAYWRSSTMAPVTLHLALLLQQV